VTIGEAHHYLAGLNRLSEITFDVALQKACAPMGSLNLADAFVLVALREYRMELALDIYAVVQGFL